MLVEQGYQAGVLENSDFHHLSMFPQSEVRFGLPHEWELSALVPSYMIGTQPGGRRTYGFGDASFTALHQIATFKDVVFSADATLTVPSGRKEFSAGGVEAQVEGLVGYDITEKLGSPVCGIAAVSRATGIAPSTIGRGLKDLAAAQDFDLGRVRRPGGGDKRRIEKDPTLLADLLALVEPDVRGDPMSPLRWTCKSLSQLRRTLVAMGHKVGRSLVGDLLHQQRFSLQANRKTREGSDHPDRNAQFSHLNESVRAALAAGEPVISVDTKKKELVGNFKNAGRAWRPQGDPEEVNVHDFLIEELGRGAVWHLRSRRQYGLGECRHELRHFGVRRADDPPLVA